MYYGIPYYLHGVHKNSLKPKEIVYIKSSSNVCNGIKFISVRTIFRTNNWRLLCFDGNFKRFVLLLLLWKAEVFYSIRMAHYSSV